MSTENVAKEFAHVVKRPESSEVTVLEMIGRPLGNFDPDLVRMLAGRDARAHVSADPVGGLLPADGRHRGLV